MDWLTAGFLAVDGVTNGLIYALMALALVLAFSVTRVILVPVGELEDARETGGEPARRDHLGHDLSARVRGDPFAHVPGQVTPSET